MTLNSTVRVTRCLATEKTISEFREGIDSALDEKLHYCARSTGGILRTRRGSLKAAYHLELLYLSNRPFTDTDAAPILNSIIFNKMLWDNQGVRCMHVLGEKLILVQNSFLISFVSD